MPSYFGRYQGNYSGDYYGLVPREVYLYPEQAVLRLSALTARLYDTCHPPTFGPLIDRSPVFGAMLDRSLAIGAPTARSFAFGKMTEAAFAFGPLFDRSFGLGKVGVCLTGTVQPPFTPEPAVLTLTALTATVGYTDWLSDSFTDTAGTDLASHTPEIGGAWSYPTGNGEPGDLLIDPTGARLYNVALALASALTIARNAVTVPTADYRVFGNLTWAGGSVPSYVHLYIRLTTGRNGYRVKLYHLPATSTIVEIDRLDAGAPTILGFFSLPVNHNQTSLEITVLGSVLTAYVDGVQKVQVTDATYSAAGGAGIGFDGSVNTSTTGYRWLDILSGPLP